MNTHPYGSILVIALGLLLATGCSSPEAASTNDAPEYATVQLALEGTVESPNCPLSLSYPDVKSLRLRLVPGSPENIDDTNPVFDTSDTFIAADGCLSFVQCAGAPVQMDDAGSSLSFEERAEACIDAGGALVPATLINVTDLETSAGMTAYLEIFSEADCSAESLAFVGLRGEIDISQGAERAFHISPLCKGHFTTLPTPLSQDLDFIRDLVLTECERDCDCVEPFKDILKKECTEAQLEQTTVAGAPVHCVDSRCTADYGFEEVLRTECEGDSECHDMYPYSSCLDSGYCTVDSYYPLEPSGPMAFHSANRLPDGSIALAGGFTEKDGTTFLAEGEAVLRFDPSTMVFHTPTLAAADDGDLSSDVLNRAMHASIVDEEDNILVLSGGLQSAIFEWKVDDEDGTRKLEGIGTENDVDARSDVVALSGDMTGNAVLGRSTSLTKEELDQPIALQSVEQVMNNGKSEYLFTGGIAPEDTPGTNSPQAGLDTSPLANLAVNCVFNASLNTSCLVNSGVFTRPRGGAAGACFERTDEGICTQFATIGGSDSGSAQVGELFVADEEGAGRFETLTAKGSQTATLRRTKFGKLVSFEDGRAVSFGGVDAADFSGPANVDTMVLSLDDVDTDTPLLKGKAVGGDTGHRMHHAVTKLDESRVLVTGGLDESNLPTKEGLVFNADDEEYEGEAVLMSRARFGHQATLITTGPLKGAVLITGGFTSSNDDSSPTFVPTAEIFVP